MCLDIVSGVDDVKIKNKLVVGKYCHTTDNRKLKLKSMMTKFRSQDSWYWLPPRKASILPVNHRNWLFILQEAVRKWDFHYVELKLKTREDFGEKGTGSRPAYLVEELLSTLWGQEILFTFRPCFIHGSWTIDPMFGFFRHLPTAQSAYNAPSKIYFAKLLQSCRKIHLINSLFQ